MSNKIYIWTIIISLLILIPDFVWDCNISTILSSIGCSGIAAAIMAFFLESTSGKKEKERKIKARAIYFRKIEDQLKMMLERILWFDERLNDDFDWTKDIESYLSLRYMIYASEQYPNKETISFEEVKVRLNTLKDKYSIERQAKMQPEKLQKVQKMFSILFVSGQELLLEANSIWNFRIELDTGDYMTLNEIENIYFQIYFGISMCRPNKNYSLAISSLESAYKMIRKVGNYNNEFNVGLHGTIKMSEI